jgi:hypothetical protein
VALKEEPGFMKLTAVDERAQALLDEMRQTPMRRGALSEQAWRIRSDIADTLVAERVPGPLARRVAFQLAFKFDARGLHDREVWRALAHILRREVGSLRKRAGMRDQRISVALPKLSAAEILNFLDELTKADRRIARTILHAAVNASDPLTAGRRYLAEYRLVVQQLRAIDPSMARTVAAATFAANVPLTKALEHMQRFASLVTKHQEKPGLARMIARACYRVKPERSAPST